MQTPGADTPVVSAKIRFADVVLPGCALGVVLFLAQNLAVWAGRVRVPAGFQPLFYLQNWDSNQYLGFLALARNHFLFPDLHAPWHTDSAMLNPLFLVFGRVGGWLGVSPVVMLHCMQLLFLMVASCVFLWTLRVFLPTRAQRMAAVVVTLCALPPAMFVLSILRWAVPSVFPLFVMGVIELTYMSADGLLRGGLSNSPTLTFGTSAMLLALGLTAMRIKTGRNGYTRWLALVAMISALVHPFEVFVIVPASVVALLILGRVQWFEAALPAFAAGLGLAPYVLLSMQHPWFRELSQTFTFDASLARIVLAYGIPILAIPYFFLVGARPKEKTDWLVLLWWMLTIGISVAPGAPFPPHLMDGFAVVTAITVVRLASNPKFSLMFQKHRRALLVMLGVVICMGGAAYAAMAQQLITDSTTRPPLLLNSVAARDEVEVLQELQRRGHVEDLALAPEPLSMMLVRAPMHSFASHEHLSFNYARQAAEAADFFDGKMTAPEAGAFLSGYGVRWVVIPARSAARRYMDPQSEAFARGQLHVYELPENHMREYPGIDEIVPAEQRAKTLSELVLGLLGR